jgi:hypothetical protein
MLKWVTHLTYPQSHYQITVIINSSNSLLLLSWRAFDLLSEISSFQLKRQIHFFSSFFCSQWNTLHEKLLNFFFRELFASLYVFEFCTSMSCESNKFSIFWKENQKLSILFGALLSSLTFFFSSTCIIHNKTNSTTSLFHLWVTLIAIRSQLQLTVLRKISSSN